jgi:uncharacterized membrane protein YidH (DUF202 family)
VAGTLPIGEGSPISCENSVGQKRSAKNVAAVKQNWRNFASELKPIIQKKMKFIAVAFIAGGLISAILSSIKYRQYPEWEHWAEKLTYLLVTIASSVVSIVGTVVLIFSIQPE